MGAMRPVDDGVLEQNLIERFYVRLVMAVLEPQTAEFAGVEFEQRRCGIGYAPEIIERAAGEQRIDILGAELRVAKTKAPTRHELIDALQVPAGVGVIDRDTVEVAILVAEEILTGDHEIAHDRVAVWRPFLNDTRDS